MLHYFKFRQDFFDPVPAREVYGKVEKGRGRPEECPPIRAGNAFGFDVLANFDVTFKKRRDGTWAVDSPVVVDSDFDWSPSEQVDGKPLKQEYAWFWERGQTVPHVITDNVYEHIKHQVKVSTFLFLQTDPNELLMFTDVPLHARRPWSIVPALVETDWYPASYPWHAVIELDPREKKVTLHKGEPLCRLVPLRRDTYFAGQMSPEGFDAFFARTQRWLSTHGRLVDGAGGPPHGGGGTVDITRTYVKQQVKSRFVVMD